MTLELEREDCDRCGGTGQITKSVAGRSGYVRCPSCDNVPEYAIPDEIPDDPRGRLEEIEEEIKEIKEKKEAWSELRMNVRHAQNTLRDVADDDLVDQKTETLLMFLAGSITDIRDRMGYGHHYHHQIEELGREKAKIRTLLEHLEDESPPPTGP